jgi:hypothetical protein
MWARVASFEGTDVERMRAEVGRRGPDELIPAGLRGVLSLADAEGKRQLSSILRQARGNRGRRADLRTHARRDAGGDTGAARVRSITTRFPLESWALAGELR